MSEKSTLDNKLKKYTSLAGGLAAVAGGVNGQVIYTDVNPDATVTGNGSIYTVDFNNDAVVDISFDTFSGSGTYLYNGITINYTATGANASVSSGNGWMGSSTSNGGMNMLNVSSGAAIGGSGAFATGTGRLGVAGSFSVPAFGYSGPIAAGNFLGVEGFVAVKFDISGNTHYGWVRLDVSSDGSVLTIKDFAYDGTPDATILAGDLSPAIDSVGITCNGAADGELTATPVQGLTGPFTYVWTDGGGNTIGTTQTITGLGPDTYTVVVTDAGANTYTASSMLVGPDVLTASVVVTPESLGNDGAIDLTVTGGTMPYSFDWDNDGTGDYNDTEDLSGLTANTYNVSAVDANGCLAVASGDVLFQMGTPTISQGASILCAGDATAELTASPLGGNAPFTYVWTDAGSNVVGTTQTITGLVAGVYTVEVTDNSSVVASSSYTITEPTALTANSVTTNETFGNDGAVDLTVTGGTSAYTYAWDNSETTEDLTGVTGGTYVVTVSDANGCTVTETATVVSTVGVEENNSFVSNVYPNPTTGSFRVEFAALNGIVEVSLLDITGRILIKETRMNPNYLEMSVAQFSKGIYTVVVRTVNSVSEVKIIKE